MHAQGHDGTTQEKMTEALRTVLWERVDAVGSEWCQLGRTSRGWRMWGTAMTAVAAEPALAHYDIALADDWSTREVSVAVTRGSAMQERRLRLTVDQQHRWQIARAPAETTAASAVDITGLIDVDLGFSPVTNTLPIRRLAPKIGAEVLVTAVWVRFPDLAIEPLPQRYLRLDERRYRYESGGGSFTAEVEVDDLGLVVDYENGWRRVAEASPKRTAVDDEGE